jgi:polygalacturonase
LRAFINTVGLCILFAVGAASVVAQQTGSVVFNVRSFGATGDGKTLDSGAINKAIETAAKAGGGTVYFPAGKYLSFSIRLKSNISLYFDQGATLLAATPPEDQPGVGYDLPEPNEWDMYQDFGHSHWHNSLIYGVGLENISIMGPGLIHGEGLVRWGGGPRRVQPQSEGDRPLSMQRARTDTGQQAQRRQRRRRRPVEGTANKAIALKLCKNVVIRDVSFLMGGHFSILATGVDNLTLDNLKIDTNRDGIDIDACRNVRISNCSVNSPNDDAIVIKSSFALGYAQATENLTLTNCQVTGYDPGTFLDGTFLRTQELAPDRDGVTGRIKFGTESNGGFKNISISNCVFDRCRGLAPETVDGGHLEDITITNITMRDIVNSPIFLRLGARMRGPDGTPVGKLRRINISDVVVYNADPRYASIISGIPGHAVEDVKLSNIQIHYQGGGTKEWAALEPPENEKSYPEPSMFGEIPVYGFYLRHVDGIELNNISVAYMKDDVRPAFMLDDVKNAEFRNIKAQVAPGVPTFVLKQVENIRILQSGTVPDQKIERAEMQSF